MATEIEIEGLDRWIEVFGRLERECAEATQAPWDDATGYMFDVSQEVVHVITGRLKESGVQYGTRVEGDGLESRIAYLAPYAIHEFRRGSEHDAITLAFVAATGSFEHALVEGWGRVWS